MIKAMLACPIPTSQQVPILVSPRVAVVPKVPAHQWNKWLEAQQRQVRLQQQVSTSLIMDITISIIIQFHIRHINTVIRTPLDHHQQIKVYGVEFRMWAKRYVNGTLKVMKMMI